MRVGINCYLLQAHIGGLKQYFLTLVDELLRSDHSNEYVLFWFEHNTQELAKLSTDKWKAHAVQLQSQEQVVDHLDRIDLYFCPFSALYPAPLPLPTVMTLVDIQEIYHPEFFTPADLQARDRYYRSSTHMANHVLTISEFSKQTIVKHHSRPADKISVAYLSANEQFYRASEIEIAPASPLPDRYIFFPANFWKHKNHDTLLRALTLLRERDGMAPDLVLTGFEQQNGYPMAESIEKYGLSKQVHVLGYVSIENLAYLYRHAEMLAFPSLFEGFGIPLVEAMAAGCPVIASRCTSIPEVVLDAAELFDPESPEDIARAIKLLWTDQAVRQRLRSSGFERAKAFSPSSTAQTHIRAFHRAAQEFSITKYYWDRFVYQYVYVARFKMRWRNKITN